MDHILIIGGTGMLKEVSLHFAKHAKVSVVARPNSNKLQILTESSSNINPIAIDYSDYTLLEESVIASIKKYGPINLAIIWIHDYAEKANEHLVKILGKSCKYFHIFGYSALNQKIDSTLSDSTDYRKVVLGQKNGMWLTPHQISEGIIKAIDQDKREFLIGK